MRFKEGSVLLSFAVLLLLACSGGQEYERVLDRAQEQNQNFENITGLDSIQKAVEYFDRHGSTNEKVRAHYLLGCAYRDAGESMKALEAYHDAINKADTTSVVSGPGPDTKSFRVAFEIIARSFGRFIKNPYLCHRIINI